MPYTSHPPWLDHSNYTWKSWTRFRPQEEMEEAPTDFGPGTSDGVSLHLTDPTEYVPPHIITWGRKQIRFPKQCVPSIY
jgi:hypothetical protein